MATGTPCSLLVIKPSSFGDIIHTLPAVARLRAAWPDCRISWLANTEWMPLVDKTSAIDEVIPFPRSSFRGVGGLWRMRRWIMETISGRQPDLALDFQGLLRSAVIGRASGVKKLWGLDDAREGAKWFYDHRVKTPFQPVHAVARYLALADAAIAKVAQNGATGFPLDWPLPPGSRPQNVGILGEAFIILHPFSRGDGKSLSHSQIQELILKNSNSKVVLIGRREGIRRNDFPGCVNLVNCTNLSELIWLTRNAAFVISVDSGPAHLAAALGRPMVAIHSWSDPRKVGPYRPDAWVWKNGKLARVADFESLPPDFFESRKLDLKASDLDAIASLSVR